MKICWLFRRAKEPHPNEFDKAKRTPRNVEKVAKRLHKHPVTIYRWIEAYTDFQRIFRAFE